MVNFGSGETILLGRPSVFGHSSFSGHPRVLEFVNLWFPAFVGILLVDGQSLLQQRVHLEMQRAAAQLQAKTVS
jgi:hypothetical protein